ncbi:MAG: NAD-dependent epimerase/dehydratase family protein [Nocardioidaceae bacterium]
MRTDERDLTVAVTGPTGTFGFGLVPLLQTDDRVAEVVGIARRPFDPAAQGWTKMTYRRGDVRDPEALEEAFRGADVVVHLAFLVVGGSREATRSINIEGTLNAYRAAVAVGARRFVYASSVAAYGFHADNPVPLGEDWPVRPDPRLFYAEEKAEVERLLTQDAADHPGTALYLLRPSIVVGPHVVGAKAHVPQPVAALGRFALAGLSRLPLPVAAPVPDLPLQLVHEDDVGQALLQCVVAAGPPGAYNIAGDGVLGLRDIAREVGILPLPAPAGPVRLAARMIALLPFLPSVAEWVSAAAQPAIMDCARAKRDLGWRPRYSGMSALRDTLGR